MPLLSTVHTCVSSISHVHVNQHRQADPEMFMFSSFQHLHTALAEHFVATPEEMIYGNEDISPLTSTFAKKVCQGCEVAGTGNLSREYFLPTYWKSNKYLGDRAFSRLQSLPATKLDN